MTTGAYVLRSVDGNVLYVGASVCIERRIREHRSKDWWGEVDQTRTEVVVAPDREAALDVERQLIRERQPRHNKHHMAGQRRPPRRPPYVVLGAVRRSLGISRRSLAERVSVILGEELTAADIAVLEAGDVLATPDEMDAISQAFGLPAGSFKSAAEALA